MPSGARLRIATRASKLALAQARSAQALLHQLEPQLAVELVEVVSEGDRVQGPLAAAGGKELFVTALREALERDEADCACHSLKDVGPAHPDFDLAAHLVRADPRDALVGLSLAELKARPAATIATSSPRRSELLARLVPGATIAPMRGNVDTRLAKLTRGEADALVLACAGLERLGLAGRIAERLDPASFVPAAGQGTIVLECRRDRPRIAKLLAKLDDAPSRRRACAERACAATIAGDCHTPLGAHATLAADGTVAIDCALTFAGAQARGQARATDPVAAGTQAARQMLAGGGERILAAIR